MNLIERAIEITLSAHSGQIDKGGQPYILHPLRLMVAAKSDDDRIVSVLHDVCEDSHEWTLDRLREEQFPENILQAIDALTRRPKENYHIYMSRVCKNAMARRVKIADLRDNLDTSRPVNPSSAHSNRLKKYRAALEYLERVH